MDPYLRKVIHPQAHENYRVILKLDEGKFVIGSIGVQGGAWSWGIDKIEELASGVRNAASSFRSLGRAHHPPATRSASRPTASSACAPAMERFDGSRGGSEPKFVIEGRFVSRACLA
jgi:hypothetical protein